MHFHKKNKHTSVISGGWLVLDTNTMLAKVRLHAQAFLFTYIYD